MQFYWMYERLSEIKDNLIGAGVKNEVYDKVRHDWSGFTGDIWVSNWIKVESMLMEVNRCSENIFQLLATRVSIK
jgi:hypothetical protein